MYTLSQQPADVHELNAKCKTLLADILGDVSPMREAVTIPAETELFREPLSEGGLFLLKEGALSHAREDRVVFFYEEGDLVGLEHCLGSSLGKIRSDFAVIVDEYDRGALLAHISAHPNLLMSWSEYLTCQIGLFTTICGGLMKVETKTAPDFKSYQQGDVIIEQGAVDTDVYTLIDGHADAFVDSVKVGEIQTDEVFGAIAALMDVPRTATVVATCDSTVLAIPKKNFIDLIEARPATVLKMVEDMASKIVSLNARLVSLVDAPEHATGANVS